MAFSSINQGIKEAFNDPNSTLGTSPIFNILINNPDIPNSFDILLDRTGDLNDTEVGTLIIGGHAPGFENIVDQPHLPRVVSGRWAVPSDGMKVNGQSFTFNKSNSAVVKPGQIAAVLDTGFALPPLPPAAVDFIYGSIPGAMFTDSTYPQWLVPCNATTSLSFVFGYVRTMFARERLAYEVFRGVEIPVHPLDITTVDNTMDILPSLGVNATFCYNTYQYIDLDPSLFAGFDVILGDAFLRNVYAS